MSRAAWGSSVLLLSRRRHLCSEWLLTSTVKKRALTLVLAAVEQARRPGLVRVLEAHGRDDVDQHAHGEETADPRRPEPGDTLDVRHQIAVAVPHDLADLGVVAGGVGLELRLQACPVRDQLLDVDVAHRVERLLAALALGRALESLERLAQTAGDRRLEELLLRPEEPEDVRLRDAGSPGDLLRRGAVQSSRRKFDLRRVEDRLAPHLRALPCRGRHARYVSGDSLPCQGRMPRARRRPP